MKKLNQEEVWDNIAEKWNDFRDIPSPAVIDFLKDKEGKILDLGSGTGRNFSAMPKNSEIYALDFSKQMLKHAKEKAKKLKLDVKVFHSPANKIEFNENFFDSAICIALLHCIENKDQRQETLKEIHRVLKPRAQVLISSWGKNSPRLKNKGKECYIPWTVETRTDEKEIKQLRYTYVYDLPELEKEVKKTGFKILRSWEERNVNIIAEK